MISRWQHFVQNSIQDLKVFLFFCVLLSLFRGAFIVLLQGYLGTDSGANDIWQALYYGARLSMKTAGIAMLLAFLFATLPDIALRTRRFGKFRLLIGAIFLTLLTVLYFARFVY